MCFPGGPGGAGPAWEVMLDLSKQKCQHPSCMRFPVVFRVVQGAVAAGPASPHLLAQRRCSAGAGMFGSRLHVQSPSSLSSCAGPRSCFYTNSCELQSLACRERWEERGSCPWQERDFIAPSEMSRWWNRRGRWRSSDAVDVCSQSPSLRRNQTSRGPRLTLEAVAVANVTHRG